MAPAVKRLLPPLSSFGARSRTCTRAPCSCAASAAHSAALPPPTTRTSISVLLTCPSKSALNGAILMDCFAQMLSAFLLLVPPSPLAFFPAALPGRGAQRSGAADPGSIAVETGARASPSLLPGTRGKGRENGTRPLQLEKKADRF